MMETTSAKSKEWLFQNYRSAIGTIGSSTRGSAIRTISTISTITNRCPTATTVAIGDATVSEGNATKATTKQAKQAKTAKTTTKAKTTTMVVECCGRGSRS